MYANRSFTRTIVFLAAMIVMATSSVGEADEKENELLAVLRSDAPPAEKAMTCKLLAIHGSSEAVAELARLLPDPQLSSWARIALEAIPGEESEESLRNAAVSLEGLLLVGTINSIGVRRDAKAVELLTMRLQDSDAEVASAAAVALGRIGNAEATQSLRAALAAAPAPANVRSAIAEGCVLCAERLYLDGRLAEAVVIYDQVRKSKVPKQRIIEATRGAILARNEEGLTLLLEQFRSPDKQRFQLALGTTREFPGGELDKALANELANAAPDRAALIIQAMADRPKTVVLAAILQAAERGPKQVRRSAIDALGLVGDASCLSALLESAGDADAELAQAAKVALSDLPSQNVDARIVTLLAESDGKSNAVLIELVGQRRIAAVPQLMKALDDSDRSVRAAALTALGETVSLKRLSVLISQVVSPKHPEDAPVALAALKSASIRMPDREACAEELSIALTSSPTTTKNTLLEILADVGGAKALKTLAAAAKSNDPQLQDSGSRLLGKWNGVDAAPVLLDLATTAPAAKYQVRALRGYIGLARKFDMPEQQRVEMCQQALDTARRPEERKLVLDVLAIHPSTEALSLAIDLIKDQELSDEATRTSLVIAQKIGGNSDVSAQLAKAGFEKVELDITNAEYGSGSTQMDVTSVLQKQTGDLPLITLATSSYNASFGGDPVPGSPKQLTIKYRMNGKAGEASFAENALIILPMPK